jgi:sorting nexin-13
LFISACRLMISRHLIIAGACFLLGIIGIQTTIYWILILSTFLLGFVIHLIIHRSEWMNLCEQVRTIKTSFIKGKLLIHIDDSGIDALSRTNDRAPLTGIPVIDEQLYETIDLFVRDYVEIWYKTQISSDESFIQDVKNGIYITIRHLTERLREIDWLDFCTGTVVDSFATHVRLYRNAKERMRVENSTDIRATFFDLEAEYERGICRDEVCMDRDKEKEFLRDIVEVLIYTLLPANEFRCVPARMLLREVAVNMGLVPFIDMYTDPDAINQLIIKMCQQIPLTIENFLLVARTTDSRAELSTLAERIDIEISRWRSKDTGGENDADIRATLNSYHYLKRLLSERLEKQAPIMDDDELLQKVTYHDLPLTEILNNCNGLDYFLKFLQTIDAVGYANFYLNAEAFRCAGLSVQQQSNANVTPEQLHANLEILRNMANDLIEQYFLPTGAFKLPIDENLIQKTLKILRTEAIDETLLDELQSKVFEILSSDKYYGQFKTTSQYLKVLSEIDLTDSLTDNSDAVSLSSTNSNDMSADFTESQHSPLSATISVSSTSSMHSPIPDFIDNLHNYSITTEINDSGVCCEKGEKYAIYVITVTCKPLYSHVNDQKREWITYRRYSEFNDLDITIKKRYPDLRQYVHLPNKSLINNTSADVRIKRQKELNDYLTVKKKKL